MPATIISENSALSFDELLARLSERELVEGVLVMGSAGSAALTPASDYDLLVVLSKEVQPLFLVVTAVEGRMAELYFATTAQIASLGAGDPLEGYEATMAAWLRSGRIIFDRAGLLARAQRTAQADQRVKKAGPNERYNLWFGVNYNLRQTRRILTSDDPVYQMTVDLRLLYTLMDLFSGYFTLRGLPWQGEKQAIRHLAAHDPSYLELFQQCLAEPERTRKVKLYERLAQLTLAPVGALWPPEATAVQLAGEAAAQPQAVEEALAFWESLI
jgi:hypothetical protein